METERIKELYDKVKEVEKLASAIEDELTNNEKDIVGGVKLSLGDLLLELE